MIKGLFNTGATPVLERMIQFTAARHQQLAHNIANLDTPNFRPDDTSVSAFQQALGDAIDRRRAKTGGPFAPLELRSNENVVFSPAGVHVRPTTRVENILFHDRNNRSLEDHMQDLAENTLAHNTAVELLKAEFELTDAAIRERV